MIVRCVVASRTAGGMIAGGGAVTTRVGVSCFGGVAFFSGALNIPFSCSLVRASAERSVFFVSVFFASVFEGAGVGATATAAEALVGVAGDRQRAHSPSSTCSRHIVRRAEARVDRSGELSSVIAGRGPGGG